MAVAIRGTTPGTSSGTGDPTSVVLNGTRQPNSGDVLIIIHCNLYYTHANIVTPTVGGSTTGVTAVTNGDIDVGDDGSPHIKSWYYVVGSTGDLTVQEDETGAADEEKALIVYVLSGVDTAGPVDVAAVFNDTGSDFDSVAPSVSPTSSDAFLICHVSTGIVTAGTFTPPGGMSETYDIAVAGVFNAAGATQQLVASGATGTRTFTSTQLFTSAGLSVAVKTGTGGGAPTLIMRPAVVAP